MGDDVLIINTEHKRGYVLAMQRILEDLRARPVPAIYVHKVSHGTMYASQFAQYGEGLLRPSGASDYSNRFKEKRASLLAELGTTDEELIWLFSCDILGPKWPSELPYPM